MASLARRFLLCGLLASSAWLAGCSKPEPEAPPPAAAAAAAPKPSPLKAAFVYIGPVGDAGWTYGHDRARQQLDQALGDKVKTTFVEKVDEGDAERVMRDLAAQGHTLIVGTTFGYMEPMLRVAADHPGVKFEHVLGYKPAPNLRTYDARTYEGAYLAGIVAGGMSKTGVLGAVGTYPIPWVLRNINAFTLGAQAVNPKVRTRVVWINTWYDPGKESDAAQTLISQGADVLFQNSDSTAVVQTAEKKGKFAIGWNSDMSSFGPKAHLASSVIDWTPYYKKTVDDVLQGRWKSEPAWLGLRDGAVDLASVSDQVPAALRQKVDQARAGLKDGSVQVFKGPVSRQDGKPFLADGEVADDKALMAQSFLVRGVVGALPNP